MPTPAMAPLGVSPAKSRGPLDLAGRTLSEGMATLTGRPRAVARAALDVVGDDVDSAYKLLVSDLALTVTDGLPCEIEPLQSGVRAWLSEQRLEPCGGGVVKLPGAFAGCSLLRVAEGRLEDLHLFALEPIEVSVLASSSSPVAPGWSEVECAEVPTVEGIDMVGLALQACRYDPGAVVVPLAKARLPLVRLLKKSSVAPPKNSLLPKSQYRKRSREVVDAPQSCREVMEEKVEKAGSTKRHYRTLEVAGQGSFGKVYLAEDEGGNRVAVKCVQRETGHRLREVEILQQIHHSCIISLIDSFDSIGPEGNSVLHIVMDYLPENLSRRIGGKPLQPDDFRCFVFQILRALAHLDGMQICHRDLKPENMLLDGCALKLADFGSAKMLSSKGPSSSYICSRWWRAPELVLGASEYSTSIDWWSCGCVAAEMMSGGAPFRGPSSLGQMYEIVRKLGTPSLTEVQALNPRRGGKLASQIERLAKSKLERPPQPWKVLLPAYAGRPDALEIVEKLLVYNPGARWHPAKLLQCRLFEPLPEDPRTLPEDIFSFTELELSKCTQEARDTLLAFAARRHAKLAPAPESAPMDFDEQESSPKRRRLMGKTSPEKIVSRQSSLDLSDIP
mmetsp:Transcript_145405/g.279125  ORF Transcript_145405/g.279125 Transcript_145405/m.279125 type:complete len:618 (+) Transcript_145405:85-1938(+)